MFYRVVFAVLVLYALQLNAQFTEKVLYSSPLIQIEPTGMVHPLDSNYIFISSVTTNTSTGFRSEGVYVSTDGGLTFRGSDTCKGEFILNHGGDPGAVVTPTGKLVLTHLGNVFPGLYSHTSTDNGLSWSNSVTVTSVTPEDKSATIIDASQSSPYFGRIYSFWVDLNQSPFAVNYSYSVNDGINWSGPVTINPNPPKRCSGAAATIDADGTIYVAWAGIASTSPFVGEQVGFASSTNGGQTWTVNQSAFTCRTISGVLSQKSNIRVNGLPRIEVDKSNGPRRGYIYIVTTETNSAVAGTDADIILRYSSDKGSSWSAPLRVNKDVLNNGKTQYFPAIAVDNSGAVNILFYDDRNTTNDSTGVFLARSVASLNQWDEYPVSRNNFQPKPIVGTAAGYQGDYIALIANNSKLLPVWMSNAGGKYQLRYTTISLNLLSAGEVKALPEYAKVLSIYPNPLRGREVLTVNYSPGITGITIYNSSGEFIQSQMFTGGSGIQTVKLQTQFMAPGIYCIVPNTGNTKVSAVLPVKLIFIP